MGFTLKIYILGLIAFLPGPDGDRMTVLVVDAREGYTLSDGHRMEPHEPLLLARSSSCEGDCRDDVGSVVESMFHESSEAATVRLESALAGGAVWRLNGTRLEIEPEATECATALKIRGGLDTRADAPDDPEAFRWVARIEQVAPGAGTLARDILAERPTGGLIAGRLDLAHGEIYTESRVRLDQGLVELRFKTLGGRAPAMADARPLADRVVAEIPIRGCEVTIEERPFADRPARSITLAPENCDGNDVVELALVNLPVGSFGMQPLELDPEMLGKHFEMYYELSASPPASDARPIPVLAGQASAEGEARNRSQTSSALLSGLVPVRGAYSRPICPMTQFSTVAEESGPQPGE